MVLRRSVAAIMFFSIIFISANRVFSQEVIKGPAEQQAVAEPEIQWLWGEVLSLDAGNNEITVKYLDYENDVEREITIAVDEKTTYENIKSLNELKTGDNASIDYIVGADGRNIAKNIAAEQAESPEEILPSDVMSEEEPQAMPEAEMTPEEEDNP
ncbi:MAG: hypothetical protein WC321_02710 [Candidatus Omnitrophota bacterium]|jgi:hypothetical protein